MFKLHMVKDLEELYSMRSPVITTMYIQCGNYIQRDLSS